MMHFIVLMVVTNKTMHLKRGWLVGELLDVVFLNWFQGKLATTQKLCLSNSDPILLVNLRILYVA